MKIKKVEIPITSLLNTTICLLLLTLGIVIGGRYQAELSAFTPFLFKSDEAVPPSSRLNGNLSAPADKEIDFGVFWEVWSLLERDYLNPEELNAGQMVDGAIHGMTAAIGDPYTVYLPPDVNKRSGEDLQGSFFGVGIELGYIDQTLAVIAPLDGTPASEAGLEAGDLILNVKDDNKGIDESTGDWTLIEAVDNIRGERGTPVTFTIYRDDTEEPFEVTVVRDEIVVDTVTLDFREYDDFDIAVLRVSRFGGRTERQWNEAVERILKAEREVKGIVFDLRNNPGGYFDGAIQLASDFIENDVVVTQKGKYTQQDYRSKGIARLRDYPLVVLVNRGSASASEILAGALRDDLGILLIGEQTFGKGTVQERKEISNQGGLHVTVGRWMLPKGDWIHDEGIPVDIEVEQDRDTEEDEVLERALLELI